MLKWLPRKLRDGYQKAQFELGIIRRRSYPDFVLRNDVGGLAGEIPVFCFHGVTPHDFERLLKHLVRNNYRTLTADDFHQRLVDPSEPAIKSVVLTFDDGLRSTWSIAYPLLRKYGLTGVCFLVPHWLGDETELGWSLEDYWAGNITSTELSRTEQTRPYISWAEAREMDQSGVIDFQSHSLSHTSVFTSGKLVDFVNPTHRHVPHKIPLTVGVPVDPFKRSALLGMPLYTVAPRLTGARRFVDDPALRQQCLDLVRDQGGEPFFSTKGWRKKLERLVRGYRGKGSFETDQQRHDAIIHELLESKTTIEGRLHKPVRHLCYPFFAGSAEAIQLSRDCDYISNFWGWMPGSSKRDAFYGREHSYAAMDLTDFSCGDVLRDRRTNRSGDDPFRIVRIPGDYILRLPGEGRTPLSRVLLHKTLRNLKRPRFPTQLAHEGSVAT